MMPGPTWYAKDIFSGTLQIPAGEMTAAMPLRWNNEPITTGQVGGGPWIISKHSKNMAAAVDFVKWVTTSNQASRPNAPGYPSYGPAATVWLTKLDKDPVLRRARGPGDEGGREPDLEGLEHGHLPGPARLVEHASSRSSSPASR